VTGIVVNNLRRADIMKKESNSGISGRFLVGHALCFWHNTFKDCAPDDKAVAARSAFLFE